MTTTTLLNFREVQNVNELKDYLRKIDITVGFAFYADNSVVTAIYLDNATEEQLTYLNLKYDMTKTTYEK